MLTRPIKAVILDCLQTGYGIFKLEKSSAEYLIDNIAKFTLQGELMLDNLLG
jgi:hypothetical protein